MNEVPENALSMRVIGVITLAASIIQVVKNIKENRIVESNMIEMNSIT